MEEVEIKPEPEPESDANEISLCSTCLSGGRRVVPIGRFASIFKGITGVLQLQNSYLEEMLICWECEALLRKAELFQAKARQADSILSLGQHYHYGTLSTLTTVALNDSDHIIYKNDPAITPTDFKIESDNVYQNDSIDKLASHNYELNDSPVELKTAEETEIKLDDDCTIKDHVSESSNQTTQMYQDEEKETIESSHNEIIHNNGDDYDDTLNYDQVLAGVLENQPDGLTMLGRQQVKSGEGRQTTVPSGDTFERPMPNRGQTQANEEEEEDDTFNIDQIELLDGNSLIKDEKPELIKDKKREAKIKWNKQRKLENMKPKYTILRYPDVYFGDLFRIYDSVNGTNQTVHNNQDKIDVIEKRIEKCKSPIKARANVDSKFKCHKCMIGFDQEELVQEHNTRWHTNKDPYVCDKCSSIFKTKEKLETHIQEHSMYKCVLCSPTHVCVREHRERHIRRKHKRIWQCAKCGLRFINRRKFFQHFKEWHKKFICDLCGYQFKLRFTIIKHFRTQHKPNICNVCTKSFTRPATLKHHKLIMHSTNLEKAYCVECDLEFKDIYRYRKHLTSSNKHSARKKTKHKCLACDRQFSKKIYMKNHYDLVHLKIHNYRCEDCDKTYVRRSALTVHRRSVHERIKPAKNKLCLICGRGFSNKRILENHIRTHTGSRPFACDHCHARFAQKHSLTNHIKTIHTTSELASRSTFSCTASCFKASGSFLPILFF